MLRLNLGAGRSPARPSLSSFSVLCSWISCLCFVQSSEQRCYGFGSPDHLMIPMITPLEPPAVLQFCPEHLVGNVAVGGSQVGSVLLPSGFPLKHCLIWGDPRFLLFRDGCSDTKFMESMMKQSLLFTSPTKMFQSVRARSPEGR